MDKHKIWHVLPENDNKPHLPISEIKAIIDGDGNIGNEVHCDCGCEPNIIYEENGTIIIVHEAFDERPNAYFKNADTKSDTKIEEKVIGALNKEWGLKGFKTAMPGHVVYDDGNRYVIYLEPDQPGETKRIAFYKETLKQWIDFS